MQELIRVIRADPAIAGRVLKFANSALFGLRTRPSSIEAAVPILGTTLVRTLVLGFSLAKANHGFRITQAMVCPLVEIVAVSGVCS